ncbi:ester cyclase [Amycolatopsis sp.]|uniref:ester cyclase n=1 Tax=Amycolatopsis sp. TaxID=37632 RepID=UPI002CF17C7D|nr:ester cyclase [Amycolatopsis sp.]HVV09375.1 ester cyclase [Amycolatopsis sp.]
MVSRGTADLVRRFYADAWNRWDDAAVAELLAPDFVFRGSLGDETRGHDSWRGYRDRVRAAVPDFHNEIVELVAEHDRAAARLWYSGHAQGELLGVSGGGAPIGYSGAAFFTAAGGLLTSAWVLGDLDTLRSRLP